MAKITRSDKAAKRAAKAERRAAATADLPIIWFERSGPIRRYHGHECPDHHTTWRETDNHEWPDPKPAPISCDQCGVEAVMTTLKTAVEMRRPDTGELVANHHDLPAGAVWEAFDLWRDREGGPYHNWSNAPDRKGRRFRVHRPGPDGRVLACMLPDRHEWIIDSRCNNCTLPKDDQHWCWVREGKPEDGTLHVGKQGLTCSAGAGSIASAGYHGFLHHGRLRRC